jgi:hypothetical protein
MKRWKLITLSQSLKEVLISMKIYKSYISRVTKRRRVRSKKDPRDLHQNNSLQINEFFILTNSKNHLDCDLGIQDEEVSSLLPQLAKLDAASV